MLRKILILLKIDTRYKSIVTLAWVYIVSWTGLFFYMALNWNDLPIYIRIFFIPMIILSPDIESIKQLLRGEFKVYPEESGK